MFRPSRKKEAVRMAVCSLKAKPELLKLYIIPWDVTKTQILRRHLMFCISNKFPGNAIVSISGAKLRVARIYAACEFLLLL